jgi:hypothetical protein
VIEHALDRVAERLQAVLLHQPEHRGRRRAHADDLGVDVARDHLRHARVRERHAVDVVDALAAAEELDAGKDRAFLEYVDGVGRVRLLAADVEPVALDRRVADQLLVVEEDRHHHRGILRMRAGAVRIVVEDDVARLERFLAADRLDGGLDAEVHRAHEER